jgi:hypothetical protein
MEAPEYALRTAQAQEAFSAREFRSNSVDVALEPKESDLNGEVHLANIPCQTAEHLARVGRRCTI